MIVAFWLVAWSALGSGQPGESDPCVDLREAKASIHAADLPAAQLALESCVVALPRNAEAWHQLGLVHFGQRHFDPAAAALERSLALNARQPQAYKMLGRVETARSKPALAERAFVEAARLDPDDAEARYLLGRLYQSEGRLAEAARALKEALALDPNSVRALAFLGTVCYGLGDAALSEESFVRAVSLNRASKVPDAIPHLEQARPADVDGSLRYQLVRAYQAAGRTGQAETALKDYEEFRKAREADSDVSAQDASITPP